MRISLSIMLGTSLVIGGFRPAFADTTVTMLARQDYMLRATLDDGLQVVIVRDILAPTVSTQITYQTGGYHTPKGFPAGRNRLVIRWNWAMKCSMATVSSRG